MKNIIYIFIGLLYWSCQEPIHGELGDPASKIDGINGSWELVGVMQTDEKAPDKRQIDLSKHYHDLVLNFNKENFTFQQDTTLITQGKNFLGTFGEWGFYNSQLSDYDQIYPDILRMVQAEGDTLDLALLKPIRVYDPVLELKLFRICEGENKSSYHFIFHRR